MVISIEILTILSTGILGTAYLLGTGLYKKKPLKLLILSELIIIAGIMTTLSTLSINNNSLDAPYLAFIYIIIGALDSVIGLCMIIKNKNV